MIYKEAFTFIKWFRLSSGDSDTQCLPVSTSSAVWLLNAVFVSKGQRSSHVLFAHFLCSTMCHLWGRALLLCLIAMVISSRESLHPKTSIFTMYALFLSFCSLPRQCDQYGLLQFAHCVHVALGFIEELGVGVANNCKALQPLRLMAGT